MLEAYPNFNDCLSESVSNIEHLIEGQISSIFLINNVKGFSKPSTFDANSNVCFSLSNNFSNRFLSEISEIRICIKGLL